MGECGPGKVRDIQRDHVAGAKEDDRDDVRGLEGPRSCGNARVAGRIPTLRVSLMRIHWGVVEEEDEPRAAVCEGEANNKCQRARVSTGQRDRPGG